MLRIYIYVFFQLVGPNAYSIICRHSKMSASQLGNFSIATISNEVILTLFLMRGVYLLVF